MPLVSSRIFILAGLGVFCSLFFLSSNFAYPATDNSATIQWTANSEPDLAGYRIYHGMAPGIYGYSQTVNKITSFQYANLEPNKTHYFTITAFDLAGNESLPSPEVSKYVAGDSVSLPPPPPSSLIISNLAVASGKTYVVSPSGLQAGGLVYFDRTYTFTSLPATVQGAAYIQTANDDKAATTSAFLNFEVNVPVTVYVAHDTRITTKPTWLGTFSDTGENVVTSDSSLRLYARSFPAGFVTIGGNASGGGYSMYAIIVKPQEKEGPDTNPPTIALTAPSNGTSVSGTISLSATATDDIGVAGVQFQVNGKSLGAEDTTNSYSVSWNTGGVTPGSYTLTAIARDAAGNTTTSAPINVTVLDITPPTVSLTSPTNGSTLSGTVTLMATATDNVGVSGVQFQMNGNSFGVEDVTAPFSLPWDTTKVPNGSYTIKSIARDAAGNTTTASAVTVSVSNSTQPSSSLLISDLAVASGKSYAVPAGGLKPAGLVYIDRSYTFTNVPDFLQGAAYIQTANSDKTGTASPFLTFKVNQAVKVYVAHDMRITIKPSWLSTFSDTGVNVVTSDTTLRLFVRSYAAGLVTIGHNGGGGGYSMYSVMVQPAPSVNISSLTVASGKSYAVPAGGLKTGGLAYIDRSYTFTNVPDFLKGAAYIQTANSDKTGTTSPFLSFRVDLPVKVYVAHDMRIATKPSWLSTFSDTGVNVVTSDTTLRLFVRSYAAGLVTIGHNGGGGGYSMYSVVVQP